MHEKIYFKYVVPAITEALNQGEEYIPNNEKYRNDFSLSLIANAILYGEKNEGYEDLYDIGIKIYNKLGKGKKDTKVNNEQGSKKSFNFFKYWWNTYIVPELEKVGSTKKDKNEE